MLSEPYYPIGIQDFEKIRATKAVYVDKTALIYNMVRTSTTIFLSRPRRFGKSLLSSTLQYYFEGRKDLFTGLAIEKLEKDWTQHPVLHFDLSTAKSKPLDLIYANIANQLRQFEDAYGVTDIATALGDRLTNLIKKAVEKTKQRVVVLIDEYDAPILDVLHDDAQRDEIRRLLREFYSPLKSCDRFLRFVFITGISTFSQLSIFSELNNLEVISQSEAYNAICGITKQELLENFKYGIETMAEKFDCSTDEIVLKLTERYDGYHFNGNSVGVFNPFSLLNAFKSLDFGSYWFQSGTPTFLVEMLRRHKSDWRFSVESLEATKPTSLSRFCTPLEMQTGALPLLYQAGYLTIKDYNKNTDLYTLGIPNTEVRVGLLKSLIPLYSEMDPEDALDTSKMVSASLRDGNVDEALDEVKSLLSSIPFMRGDRDILGDAEKTEAYYHRLFFIIFKMLHREVSAEVRSSKGAADVVVKTKKYIYVIEIKIDESADAALQQIDTKGYAQPYLTDGRKVIKLGVSFSTELRTLTDWQQA